MPLFLISENNKTQINTKLGTTVLEHMPLMLMYELCVPRDTMYCGDDLIGAIGTALVSINVVALHRARLLLRWVTARGYTVLVFNSATKANSAWHLSMGRRNEDWRLQLHA